MTAGNRSRIALVTGASSGIGEAIARRLVDDGFRVVGNGRNEAKLEALEADLGDGFRGRVGDASEAGVIEALFDHALEQFGGEPDLVVANAGRGLGGSVCEADLTEFGDLLRINVTGALLLLQAAARRMVERQARVYPDSAADIVIVGSVVGKHVSPFSAVYGASKFAVHSLAEGLRRGVGPKGVRVSLVQPGMVLSGFQRSAGYSDQMVEDLVGKFGPLPTCEEVADALGYIVSRPPHVNISEIVVRGTRQDYP